MTPSKWRTLLSWVKGMRWKEERFLAGEEPNSPLVALKVEKGDHILRNTDASRK